jgi:hypothetical protein
MTYEELNILISSFGLPYAYNQFPDDTEQEPPFICFLLGDSSGDLMADNINYQPIRPLSIELYTDNKDFELEMTIEAGLLAAGLPFVRSETYIDSERMFQIVYDTTIILTQEEFLNV